MLTPLPSTFTPPHPQKRYVMFFASTKTLIYYASETEAKSAINVKGQKSAIAGVSR